MASRADDSDGGDSMTPSENSDGDDRSEHDSDYETDDGKEIENESRDKNLNIIWTGYAKRIPVILFNASSILGKNSNCKTVGDQYHMAFKFGGAECKVIRNIFLAHGFHEVHPNCPDFNLVWSSSHLKPFTLRCLTEFQKINHFPRSSELTRKDRLYKNIQRMQQIKGVKHFDFVPQTFVMPNEYQEFCSHFLKDRGPWIVKPVASSRGRGVFLVNHPDQVPFDENVIVSQYLHNPLVIDGFKFDIRLYVAVTSYDPLVIYLYEEGLARFATVKYERNTKHLRNQCMHLTNYSVNKKSNDYVKNDDPDVEDYGNKWSMGAMLRYLRSMGKDTAALMMRIEDVVIKTLLSVELSIATACKMFMPYRGNCFELYGFDILVDDTLKPWVLEVNLSPSLACDSPLDLKIKGNMLCDLFSLTGIICHDPVLRSLQHQSRRNQELVKLTGRAKTALTRTGFSRLVGIYPRFGPFSVVKKARPQSASSSAKSGSAIQGGKTGMTGLNSEEIKIVRRVKEEDQRKGGWIRIFPSPDTWDVHGQFLQFNTTHNLMLHQRLYPERHKQMGVKSTGSSSFSAATRSKNGYLQVTGTGQRPETDKAIESYTLATLRARQYERKLGPRVKRRRKDSRHKDVRGRLVQGIADDLEEGENLSEEECEQMDGRAKQQWVATEDSRKLSRTTTTTELRRSSTTVSAEHSIRPQPKSTGDKRVVEVKVEVPYPQVPLPVPTANPVSTTKPDPANPVCSAATKPFTAEPGKYRLEEVLDKGGTLSKVQARSAFAMYLQRVKERLVSEGHPAQEDMDSLNEQMDLVLRFLKRAAVNLQQNFRVVIPSRRLPLGDRKHILAKQLADFVHIYSRETELLKSAEKSGSQNQASKNGLDETLFDKFIATASESELEQILTTYTKLNKSSSIFLGSSTTDSSHSSTSAPTKPPHTPLPPPQVQRFEMMQQQRQRREAGGEGDHCHHGSLTGYAGTLRERSMDRLGSAALLSRPSSASSSSSSAAAVCAAVSGAGSVFTERLGRPFSATYFKPAQALKLISRPSSAKPSPLSTSEPVIDTYNEEAIREALQRLTVKQQARQYAAGNSAMALKKPAPLSTTAISVSQNPQATAIREERSRYHHHRRGSLTPLDEQTADYSTTHPGTLPPQRVAGLQPGSSTLQRSYHRGQGESCSTSSLPMSLLLPQADSNTSNKNADYGKFTVTQSSSLQQQRQQSDPPYPGKRAQQEDQAEPVSSAGMISLPLTNWRPDSVGEDQSGMSEPVTTIHPVSLVRPSLQQNSQGLERSSDQPEESGQRQAQKQKRSQGVRREKVGQGKPPRPAAKEELGSGGSRQEGSSTARSVGSSGGGKASSQYVMDMLDELSNIALGNHAGPSLGRRLSQPRLLYPVDSGADLTDSQSVTSPKSQPSQRSTEQKTLMEASKAKHHAMVAQAHAAQRGGTTLNSNSRSRRDWASSKPPHSMMETGEVSIARGTPTFSPKPPVNPPATASSSSRSSQMQSSAAPYRVTRLSSVENLSLSLGFHSSMKYSDIHTQLRKKTQANAGQ